MTKPLTTPLPASDHSTDLTPDHAPDYALGCTLSRVADYAPGIASDHAPDHAPAIASNHAPDHAPDHAPSTDLDCWMAIEEFRHTSYQNNESRDSQCKIIQHRFLTKEYFFGVNSPAGKRSQGKVSGVWVSGVWVSGVWVSGVWLVVLG